jgi:hypothetical protein
MTRKEQVRALAKNVLLRLEQDGSIALNPLTRQTAFDQLYGQISQVIWTDEDIREKVIRQLGDKAGMLEGNDATESEQFRAAKAVLLARVSDHVIHGLYYQRSVKEVASFICVYLMKVKEVEEVFLSDEELEKTIVEFLKRFDPAHLH